MKKVKSLLVFVALISIFVVSGCGKKKQDLSKYAGTYTGKYYKYVGDETKYTEEEFSLVLNEDGTGKHNRNNNSFKVTWEIDGENFKMSETFVGDPIIYEGTLKDGKLDIYNGDKTNNFTVEYVYEK